MRSPHIFTRKSRLQPGEFLITSAKRLLQHGVIPGSSHTPAQGISSPGTDKAHLMGPRNYVDRRDRVQLVDEEGRRVTRNEGDHRVPARAGKDVPAGTMAVVRSPDFLRALIRETALATLIHQRRLTPSCGGHAPTAERTVGPARMIAESLTPKPGIREQNLPEGDIRRNGKEAPIQSRK